MKQPWHSLTHCKTKKHRPRLSFKISYIDRYSDSDLVASGLEPISINHKCGIKINFNIFFEIKTGKSILADCRDNIDTFKATPKQLVYLRPITE